MSVAVFSGLLGQTHFTDAGTLLAGLVAVVLVGISKGGLGWAFALMGVPVLALVMPPAQAAVAVLVGAALVRRMRPAVFYPFMLAMVALVGPRLV